MASLTDFRPLKAPRDAALLKRASPKAASAYGAAKRAEKLYLEAAEKVAEGNAKSLVPKILNFRSHRQDCRLLEELKLSQRKHRVAFDKLMNEIRQSAPYREIAATASQTIDTQTPPASSRPRRPRPTAVHPSDVAIELPSPPAIDATQPVEPDPVASIEDPSFDHLDDIMDVAFYQASAPAPSISGPAPYSITNAPTGSVVDHLFAPRSIDRPDAGPLRTRSRDRIYLAIPKGDIETAVARGAQLGKRGGVSVSADFDLKPFGRWLPLYARPTIEPILVDSIPRTNWGGSLANLLTKSSWDETRAPAIARTGGNCMVCGFNGNGKSVDCHEVWEYHVPMEGLIGVQKLVDLIALCRECHEMFHLGLASVSGRLDTALDRLAWANRWTPTQAREFHAYSRDRWNERNTYSWMLDLTILEDTPPLVLKGGDEGPGISANGDIHFVHGQGDGITRFVGVRYGQGDGTMQGPLPPLDYERFVRHV